MKKIIVLITIFFSFSILFTQNTPGLDTSLDSIWNQAQNPRVLQNSSPEMLGREKFPLIPPTPSRKIPGDSEILLPIERTEGPLNAAPNDSRAYILYNRAMIAFQNQQYEQSRTLYRELIRLYPDSSYTPYALYVLSLSETDFRRKIRILLTIKERFPNFPHRNVILDSLGDIYYLLGSHDAAEEVLVQSDSYYSTYLRAMIAMDNQRPNRAITLIREALKKAPDNEASYKIYLLYSEALLALKSYNNALIVLKKASELRAWAYDNGGSILLNAGKAFYHDNRFREALYTFGVLRLRFSRSTEARLADQYIDALNKKGIVNMITVPWIANSFDTLIKEQPIRQLTPPRAPSLADIQEMNNLPLGSVPEPSIDDITIVPPMPIPVPPRNTFSVLVPMTNAPPIIDIITVTNLIQREITNTVAELLTNRIFVVETNTLTNNFALINQASITNVVTNVVQVWETNNIVSYEPVVLWQTNYRNINITNLVTNIVDYVVTNERIDLIPLQKTNYNFVNRPQDLTNVIYRDITNRYLEYGLNNSTNWREDIIRKEFIEIVPAWKTTYQSIDTNVLVTNTITEIVTNKRLELVPRWISNIRTNDALELVDSIITNTRLRIAPRWITNYQIIQTNMRDVVITNILNTVQTNLIEQVITNVLNPRQDRTNIITNLSQEVVTNFIDEQGMGELLYNNAEIEFAPIEVTDMFDNIDNEDQQALITEPIYTRAIEEEQVKFVSQEIAHLESLASQMAEKSAGIAGEYGFSSNKGYVLRIAELRDLSVANIILKDIEQLNLGISVGIYYRESLYFVEMRSIKERKQAETIFQHLYQLGYTDIQLFEQYEVTEYQE
ncbi:MAG: tetratricopeptide repeat protein [Brevinema sp.]